ncbi:O-antigen ligase family protein [Pseudoalteromonas sp. G4]|uniref:O-antigen ligase family protein n=1 Tax=Pseudoalteromonas sp. G4 TaxID=2992761 RepID=UPI00237DB082|nr:O-antigen ligase family protein [Pseudoalteromonas sp. G4]MDE3270661.1 O-antigen ligase family protein [Pseudoalteromonas sp. G4]
MNKTIFALLCALIFWLPLPLGSYRIWAIMFFGFMIAVTFFLHLVNCAYSKQAIIPDKSSWPLLGTLLSVIFVLAIQLLPTSFQSIDPNQTSIMLLKTITMLLLVCLVLLYVNSKDRIKTFLYWLIAAGVFQALYATFLNLTPESTSLIFDYKYTQRARGSFTYQNFLANYLALCLAMGIGLLISELKIKNSSSNWRAIIRDLASTLLSSKMFLRLSLIIMIIGLILTRSRMGNSAFFIALAAVSLFAFFFYYRRPQNLRLLIISFFIVDLIIVGAMFGVEKVKERLVETSLQSETRDEVVRDSIPLILDKPLLGSGGGSFYTAFPAYQPEIYSGYYDNAHNDYIQFAVELGIPATIMLGGLLLYVLWLAVRTMMRRKTPLYQGVAFGGAIAIVHMLLHSTVDYSLQAGANSMTFAVILALVFQVNSLKHVKKKRYD